MQPLHLRGVILPSGERADVWVADGRFQPGPVAGARTVCETGYLLPGLVDAHAHLAVRDGVAEPDPARQRRHALAYRNAGALLLRDTGAPVPLDPALAADPGLPRLQMAGRFLAPPGRYLAGFARETPADELAAAAAAQAADGGGWVKIIGDWRDPTSRSYQPNYPRESLVAAVAASHAAGARVAVHTLHPSAIADAVAAGVDTVEHGCGLTPPMLAEMRRRGTALVPTLVAMAHTAGQVRAARPSPARDTLLDLLRAHAAVVASAAAAGVRLLLGTDGGGVIAHGRLVDEALAMAAAGVPAAAVLAAASWGTREYLGLPGITPGAPADLLAYRRDPRADLTELRRPVAVVLRGRLLPG